MTSLFISSGYAKADRILLDSGEELDLARLPAFLRVLLTTDGTVTKSLESFFWEPVSVVKCRQQRHILSEPLASIAKQSDDEVLLRDVFLQGDDSKRIYAYASSFICLEALPASIRVDLEQDRVGIGELLRECGLETYRELIRFGKEELDGAMLITRTYRIVMGKLPFIEITEKFPLAIYSDGEK